jgi:Reverse transcriptase (RNA-dependent DNA polymerase)/Endonuclease/Exonuclease/phosphatase family
MENTVSFKKWNIVTYNMHGFNQGISSLWELCRKDSPDLIMLQEHWLMAEKMYKFEQIFSNYFCVCAPAVSAGINNTFVRGRPAGGMAILIKGNLSKDCCMLYSCDRCIVVKIGKNIFVNLYLPCAGTLDRNLLIEDLLNNVLNVVSEHADCAILLGGDLNCDLDGLSEAAIAINAFVHDNNLTRCDLLLNCRVDTYVNVALDRHSHLDYFIVSDEHSVSSMEVINEGFNMSDHLPVRIEYNINDLYSKHKESYMGNSKQKFLRWDRADLKTYYALTGRDIQLLIAEFSDWEARAPDADKNGEGRAFIDHIYERIIWILNRAANATVPARHKNFYKFWWNQELDALKEQSVSDHRAWIAAGRPRCGLIACNARASKLRYKQSIKLHQQRELTSYNDELHQALNAKKGEEFWKCWRSKFNIKPVYRGQVEGKTDDQVIANMFIRHFENCCSNSSVEASKKLADLYALKRPGYCGTPFDDSLAFDVELVDSAIKSLKRGKAAGLDGVTGDHLQWCHPALATLLLRLFNLMIKCAYVPRDFGRSYIVPIPKDKSGSRLNQLTCEDFRGISIVCVLSKVFEKCILDRYSEYLKTSDNQFGFKKGYGCMGAVYTVKCVVDYYVQNRGTVNMCALDLRKAFDRMNHAGLFIKLMDRKVPNALLATLEYWFNIGFSCVKWGNVYSDVVLFKCGVRQGGVLSPYLFAVFIDDIVKRIMESRVGCCIGIIPISIILYADDILLLAPSVSSLQHLLLICENYLDEWDMALNPQKSACIRIGGTYREECVPITTRLGHPLAWVSQCRYLGVHLRAAKKFSVVFDANKKSYYRAVNSILYRVGRSASEEVLVKLIATNCLPVLLYGMEVGVLNKALLRTLDFLGVRLTMRIFKTNVMDNVRVCQNNIRLLDFVENVRNRKRKFLLNYGSGDNLFCCHFGRMASQDLNVLERQHL